MRPIAAAVLVLAAAPVVASDGALVLPERLGSLVRVEGARGPVAATYAERPGGPGSPLASVYDRALGVTAAQDMASNEAALRAIAGVTVPGTMLAANARCPTLIGRIDRGHVGGGDTLTASVFAVKNGRNVKLRLTAAVERGEPFVRGVVGAFATAVLGC